MAHEKEHSLRMISTKMAGHEFLGKKGVGTCRPERVLDPGAAVGRHPNDARLGHTRMNVTRRLDPIHPRHVDAHEHDVRTNLFGHPNRLEAILHPAHNCHGWFGLRKARSVRLSKARSSTTTIRIIGVLLTWSGCSARPRHATPRTFCAARFFRVLSALKPSPGHSYFEERRAKRVSDTPSTTRPNHQGGCSSAVCAER